MLETLEIHLLGQRPILFLYTFQTREIYSVGYCDKINFFFINIPNPRDPSCRTLYNGWIYSDCRGQNLNSKMFNTWCYKLRWIWHQNRCDKSINQSINQTVGCVHVDLNISTLTNRNNFGTYVCIKVFFIWALRVNTHVYLCTYISISVSPSSSLSLSLSLSLYIYIYICQTWDHPLQLVCMRVFVCMCLYLYIYTSDLGLSLILVCACTHTHTHTHTHIYIYIYIKPEVISLLLVWIYLYMEIKPNR